MTQETLLLLIGAGVVVLALLIWVLWNQRRSRVLQAHFGPEYERALEVAGTRSKAEAELEARRRRVAKLHLHELGNKERAAYLTRWQAIQARFVDDPRRTVAEADSLVGDVMSARGYPMDDFEQRAADISVEYPDVVTHYRAAHDVALRGDASPHSTEDRRQALLHYRALFAHLLDMNEPVIDEDEATPVRGVPLDARHQH
jgi:hypothetical protein